LLIFRNFSKENLTNPNLSASISRCDVLQSILSTFTRAFFARNFGAKAKKAREKRWWNWHLVRKMSTNKLTWFESPRRRGREAKTILFPLYLKSGFHGSKKMGHLNMTFFVDFIPPGPPSLMWNVKKLLIICMWKCHLCPV